MTSSKAWSNVTVNLPLRDMRMARLLVCISSKNSTQRSGMDIHLSGPNAQT